MALAHVQAASDVRYSIKYLDYLRHLSLEGSDITRHGVTVFLVRALALQVELEPCNTMQSMEEMAVLCNEVLSSDVADPDPNFAVEDFAQAASDYLLKSLRELPQQVIKCLHEANTRLPDSHPVSFALAYHYFYRFDLTKSNEDYERGMAPLDEFVDSHSLADSPIMIKHLRHCLRLAARLARHRFLEDGNPEDLEEAIVRTRALLDSISLEDPERGDIIQSLVELERKCLGQFDISNHGLPDVHPSNPEVVDLPSFSHLAASLAESNTVKSPPMTLEERLRAIETVNRITNRTDIEEAVKYCRLLHTSFQQSPDGRDIVTHISICALGDSLYKAFKRTNNPVYLNETIDVYHNVFKLSNTQRIYFMVIKRVILSLVSRFQLSKDTNDFDEIMELLPIAASSTYMKIHDRFWALCQWAQLARNSMHPSAHAAYKSAIALMQDYLTFAPTLELQHLRLVAARGVFEELPLDSASYQVHMGQLKEAIETLERGRSLHPSLPPTTII